MKKLFSVYYFEAADTKDDQIQQTIWRISEDVAREDYYTIRDMIVHFYKNLPGSFLEYDIFDNTTDIWLWSNENRDVCLCHLQVNFEVEVPAEAIKY